MMMDGLDAMDGFQLDDDTMEHMVYGLEDVPVFYENPEPTRLGAPPTDM